MCKICIMSHVSLRKIKITREVNTLKELQISELIWIPGESAERNVNTSRVLNLVDGMVPDRCNFLPFRDENEVVAFEESNKSEDSKSRD